MTVVVKQVLAMFAIIYYGFACLGCALFAGCVTEITDDGGPGNWTTAPWKDYLFASGTNYVDLSFDNMVRCNMNTQAVVFLFG